MKINWIKKALQRAGLIKRDLPEVNIYHGVINDNSKTIRQQLEDAGIIRKYPEITIHIDDNGEKRITTQW